MSCDFITLCWNKEHTELIKHRLWRLIGFPCFCSSSWLADKPYFQLFSDFTRDSDKSITRVEALRSKWPTAITARWLPIFFLMYEASSIIIFLQVRARLIFSPASMAQALRTHPHTRTHTHSKCTCSLSLTSPCHCTATTKIQCPNSLQAAAWVVVEKTRGHDGQTGS